MAYRRADNRFRFFSRSSYLSGAEKIVNGTVGMLESGEAQGSWKDIIEELAGEKESVKISRAGWR